MLESKAKEVLYRILDTPISPELLPPDAKGEINQKTEDIIGPYELHDFFLTYVKVRRSPGKNTDSCKESLRRQIHGRYNKEMVKGICETLFSQQFKRSCLPDGPKVGTISLSPRGDWRMPSDAVADSWLSELESMQE